MLDLHCQPKQSNELKRFLIMELTKESQLKPTVKADSTLTSVISIYE